MWDLVYVKGTYDMMVVKDKALDNILHSQIRHNEDLLREEDSLINVPVLQISDEIVLLEGMDMGGAYPPGSVAQLKFEMILEFPDGLSDHSAENLDDSGALVMRTLIWLFPDMDFTIEKIQHLNAV